MTEQEYINTKALGTITAAINTLKDLCAENLKDTIKDGESKKVLGTLYDWQDRLFKQTETKQVLLFTTRLCIIPRVPKGMGDAYCQVLLSLRKL